jgi:hypothetical protein
METEVGSRFDHIVPLVGFGGPGQLVFNDLHSNQSMAVWPSNFTRSRAQCRYPEPWPDRFAYCLPAETNYGVRVHGNADAEGELLPARLVMASWSEPDYSAEDGLRERPCTLTATLTASRLHPGQPYTMLRFDQPDAVPDRGFLLARGAAARVEFVPISDTYRWDVSFPSNSTTFFRVVRRHASTRIAAGAFTEVVAVAATRTE